MAAWSRWSLLALAIVTAPCARAGSTATLALTASPETAVAPASVQLTAVVSGGSLSGSIVFSDGAGPIGTAPIKHGKAALKATLDVGIHRITAAHAGGGTTIESPAVIVVLDNPPPCE
jgi:hypothetical protein